MSAAHTRAPMVNAVMPSIRSRATVTPVSLEQTVRQKSMNATRTHAYTATVLTGWRHSDVIAWQATLASPAMTKLTSVIPTRALTAIALIISMLTIARAMPVIQDHIVQWRLTSASPVRVSMVSVLTM